MKNNLEKTMKFNGRMKEGNMKKFNKKIHNLKPDKVK